MKNKNELIKEVKLMSEITMPSNIICDEGFDDFLHNIKQTQKISPKKTKRKQFFLLLIKELKNKYNINETSAKKLIVQSDLPKWTLSEDMVEYVYHYDVAYWAEHLVKKS